MPAFNETSPRDKYTVKGLELTIPAVYAAGHALTHNEAAFVNNRLASIMVNAYGGDLRRELDKIDQSRAAAFKAKKYDGPMNAAGTGPAPAEIADIEWDHQEKLDTKFASYKVGESNTREASPKDPTDRIVWDIAEREVKNKLQQKGLKVKPLIDAKNEEHGSEFKRLVYDRINHPSHKDRLLALAKAQLESANGEDEDELNIPAELQEPTAAARAEEAEAEAA
jgi:hypothetical protein